MTEKSLDDVLAELPVRQLFIGERTTGKSFRYRQATVEQVAALPGFILMEVDVNPPETEPSAVTWWPAGMVSDEIQRGIPMPVLLMFNEVRMLAAVNQLDHVLLTMQVGISWDVGWPELITN